MLKRIGIALSVVAAALAFAAPARAVTVDEAKATVIASSYVSVWHHPGHGYILETRDPNNRILRVPNRPVSVHRNCYRAVDPVGCKAAVVTYYHFLHHLWLTENRSLWVLLDSLPVCATGLADCVPPTKSGGTPVAVYVDSVLYTAHQRAATSPQV